MASEKRLIDPSVLIRDLTAMKSAYDAIALDGIIKALKEAPAVAAVEVVRCEECQSWDTKHCADGQGWCPKVCGYRHGGWFCAAGKRKTITDQTMKALEAMDKNAHGGADDGKEE